MPSDPLSSQSEYGIDYSKVPEHCRSQVQGYVERGGPTGSFLTAIFENKLVESFGKADDINSTAIRDYADFLYNEAPSPCWGSAEMMKAWRAQGGLSHKSEAK